MGIGISAKANHNIGKYHAPAGSVGRKTFVPGAYHGVNNIGIADIPGREWVIEGRKHFSSGFFSGIDQAHLNPIVSVELGGVHQGRVCFANPSAPAGCIHSVRFLSLNSRIPGILFAQTSIVSTGSGEKNGNGGEDRRNDGGIPRPPLPTSVVFILAAMVCGAGFVASFKGVNGDSDRMMLGGLFVACMAPLCWYTLGCCGWAANLRLCNPNHVRTYHLASCKKESSAKFPPAKFIAQVDRRFVQASRA